jgi:uncharacterized protein involved in response to NO
MVTVEILIVQKQIITIAILIHGRIIVAIETSAILMETNTINIATHQQQVAIEKDLMTVALMRVAVETELVHLVVLTE